MALLCFSVVSVSAASYENLSEGTYYIDGYMARRWNMISDFGKAFDPVADKLTQISVLFCLIANFPHIVIALVLLVMKEVCTGIMSLIVIKKMNCVMGAVWHGKLSLLGSLHVQKLQLFQ